MRKYTFKAYMTDGPEDGRVVSEWAYSEINARMEILSELPGIKRLILIDVSRNQ